MKRLINSFKYSGIVLLILVFFAACEKELLEEYQSVDVIGAPSLTVTTSNVGDSVFTLNYTMGAAGWLSVAVVPGTEVPVPTANNMKFKNTPKAVKTYHFEVKAGELTSTLDVTGLVQNTSYVVFTMATSVDGVSGTVGSNSITTSDNFAPQLKSTTPAVSATADKEKNFKVTLNFDEPVTVVKKEGIVFRYLNIVTFAHTDVPVDSVVVDKEKVTVFQSHAPIFGQYVFISISDDAITDKSDNYYAGIGSGLVGGFLEGLYWRIKYDPQPFATLLPAVGPVTDVNFKIVLTYDLPMGFNAGGAYSQNNVIVRYTLGGTTIEVKVPQANVVFTDGGLTVTITPPRTPVVGETVTFFIKEGAFRTRYNSPVKEVPFGTRSWLIQ